MREVTDLVDDHRAAVAAGLVAWTEHEMVEQELASSLEEIGEALLAVGSFEDVAFLDSHARQASPLGGERVARAGGLFLFCSQLGERRFPGFFRDDRRQIHRAFLWRTAH